MKMGSGVQVVAFLVVRGEIETDGFFSRQWSEKGRE
jgi:hypothetical protein